ncbi:hypothetical protein [Virgibacillus oceani]|uniref:Uncharacterized protein n=1 Tax=Virgibacillus oceani TaxID=1479511 RepID=A0A917M445_9BACI|nr:hypothetical protein [Virgibacillus oceani]GGG74285.1 hypothetical protein GCM10011398_18670 [Virgibacillus oceani]
MKKLKKLIVIALILGVFTSGYIVGKAVTNNHSREIRVGFDNHKGQIDFAKVITDSENQEVIDNFMMIYLNKKQNYNLKVDFDNPDVHIFIDSPKQFTTSGRVL